MKRYCERNFKQAVSAIDQAKQILTDCANLDHNADNNIIMMAKAAATQALQAATYLNQIIGAVTAKELLERPPTPPPIKKEMEK